MVSRVVLRRMLGAVGKASSGSGEVSSARSFALRCTAGRPLLLSTALGTGILVGAAGLTLGSTQALAACTSNTSGIASCDGTITDGAISYTATGSLTVELIGADISETGASTDGVAVDGDGHPVQVVFLTDGNTTNVTASDGTAISVVSNGGGVGVNTADIYWTPPFPADDKQNTISGSVYGIYVDQTDVASSGDANVTIGDDTVSGGSGAGIAAIDAGSGNVNVSTGAGSTVSSSGAEGIYTSSNSGNISITTGTGSDVSTGDAAGNYGIRAESTSGNIGITTNGTVSDGGIGAFASGSGAIIVTTNGDVTTTAGSAAINVGGVDGLVRVTANGNVDGSSNGISATSTGTGNVDVKAGASTIISGLNGAGIRATGSGGTVTVTADGTSITGTTDGIDAENTVGNIVVDINSGTVTGTGSGGEGVYATTGGAGTITITQDEGTTVNSTTDDGIEAVSNGTGLIHITSNGNITAGNNGGDDGITAIGLVGGAPITIDFGTGNVDASITAAGNGIEAQTSGAGKITVNAYGTISNAVGDLGPNGGTLQNNESGIWTKQTGTGDIEINTGTKSISAGTGTYDYGIYAQAADGSIDITTGTGTVTGGDDGIHAEVLTGAGHLNVIANGNVTSTDGNAIDASSVTGDIEITNYGAATSSAGLSVPVVKASTDGGSVTINNEAGGSIQAAGLLPSWGALAIQTSTGAGTVLVQNDGDITGRVDFALASTGGATFNNTANTWYTSGINNFTAGDDTLTNTSTGEIHTTGTTSFVFWDGTDAVNNAGSFFVAGDTSFTGLEAFNNSGTLDLSGDNTDTTDTVTIDGVFNGTGASKLVLDAELGWPASADLLTVGSTTGSTAIRVNNVASGLGAWLGSNFSDGILLVDGSSSASSFHLDTTQALYNASIDALDAGLFNYKLVYNGGEERLISLPGEEASQLPTFLTAAQSIWYETSPWLDRQADLRDQLKGGEGSVTPGIWGKALGRWTSRDLSQTVSAGGTSITNNVDYNQDTYGFVAGVDTGSSNVFGQGDTLLGGVSAGYVTSDQNFKSSPTSAEYKGAVLGVYGTYLKGGFFIDAMAKANLLTMDYKAPSLGGATASPDVKSYGVEVDAGQRFPLSDSAFIEPLASLTYAKTQIDTFTVANSQFDFQDATSFRGSLGLRGGATAYESSATKVDLSLTGRLWNEFEGENKMVIRSGGPDLTMTDKFDGTFGEVVGSVNIFGLGDGLSGFVNGGAKFKSNYTSGELTAGIRYEW